MNDETTIKAIVIEFADWMQRYVLYDYSKKPYKYTGRQHVNGGRSKPIIYTASQLYDMFLLQKKQRLEDERSVASKAE